MNIDKIASGMQNAVPASKSSDKIIDSLIFRITEDVFEARKPQTALQKQVLKMADEIWQDMKMPESVKPQVIFRPISPQDAGGTHFSDCKIYLPNEDAKLLLNMTVTKGTKATLAHELRHIKQLYSIARLIGTEEFEHIALKKHNMGLDTGWYEYIIQELGRIKPDSDEGKFAQRCLKGFENYPENKHFESSIPAVINHFQYKNNFLEKDARKFEKQYQEFSLIKLLASKIFNKK